MECVVWCFAATLPPRSLLSWWCAAKTPALGRSRAAASKVAAVTQVSQVYRNSLLPCAIAADAVPSVGGVAAHQLCRAAAAPAPDSAAARRAPRALGDPAVCGCRSRPTADLRGRRRFQRQLHGGRRKQEAAAHGAAAAGAIVCPCSLTDAQCATTCVRDACMLLLS